MSEQQVEGREDIRSRIIPSRGERFEINLFFGASIIFADGAPSVGLIDEAFIESESLIGFGAGQIPAQKPFGARRAPLRSLAGVRGRSAASAPDERPGLDLSDRAPEPQFVDGASGGGPPREVVNAGAG